MRRREFIALLSGAATWPFGARAQQPNRMRQIALMMANDESDPEGQLRVKEFRRGLQELGWTEGRNLRIEYRWAAGPDRAPTYARDLVSLTPDVIVANGTPALAALHQATRSIPIVFVVVVDPVGAGYVQSLGRPGGNVTGFSTFEPEMGTKWLELLKEMTPDLGRVAGISDPAFRGFSALLRAIESAAPKFGLEFTSVPFHESTDNIEFRDCRIRKSARRRSDCAANYPQQYLSQPNILCCRPPPPSHTLPIPALRDRRRFDVLRV